MHNKKWWKQKLHSSFKNPNKFLKVTECFLLLSCALFVWTILVGIWKLSDATDYLYNIIDSFLSCWYIDHLPKLCQLLPMVSTLNTSWPWNDDQSQTLQKIKEPLNKLQNRNTFHVATILVVFLWSFFQPWNVHQANLVAFFQSSPNPKPSRRCHHPRHTTLLSGKDSRTPRDCHDPPQSRHVIWTAIKEIRL